ncbi:MAG: amino acid adenylation domain-containing protein [Chlorobium sp.]|nr:MAG: amino acid adenylation domain-containing protein [Chlorobium sp.]
MTTKSHDFWRRLLADLPPLQFASRSYGSSSPSCAKESEIIELQLDAVQTRLLKAFAETHGISPRTLLLAVHLKVLSMQSPEKRTVTGITVNSGADENPIPLIFNATSNDESWSETLLRVSELEEASRRHSDLLLADMETIGGRSPLFDSLFLFNQSGSSNNGNDLLEAKIHAIWQTLLPGADFSVDDGFFDAGGNSLLLLRLHEKLASCWPGLFSVARLFSIMTIAAQASFIREKSAEEGKERITSLPEKAVTTSGHIAIVGIGVRIPGAETLEASWRDIAKGVDRVCAMPEERAKQIRQMMELLALPVPEEFREAAWLDNIFSFDPERFRISPADAALVHPEQRLFLETALMALENAGYGGNALDNEKIGVFVGMSGGGSIWSDYALKALPERAEQIFVNNVPSNIATRLSFLHNWRGAASLVDTACSSALTALHLASQALINGECRAALVGGAKLIMIPPSSATRFTIESSTSRTHAFDESADGTGAGEGSVVFFLKTMEQATLDGDPIHALILGTAINQDGASSGMAAPNPTAQAEVITAAAAKAGVSLATISYIEAHGTGTHLGDPVEIEGIRLAFGAETRETAFAFIGSGKGNYGHLDSCAGALGLLRALLCLKNDQVPPQPFFCQANPRIDFANAPVQVSRQLLALPDRGTPRRAGVSSFGLSGINVHTIIEVPPPPSLHQYPLYSGWTVIGLSAATKELLADSVKALTDLIRDNSDYLLADMAYTLNTGRDSLSERLVVWVRNRKELIIAWENFLSGNDDQRRLTSTLPRHKKKHSAVPVFCQVADEDSALAAAQAFAEGALLTWPPQHRAHRLHLPPTPLQRIICRPEGHSGNGARETKSLHYRLPFDTPEGIRYPLDVHSPMFWPIAEHLAGGVPTLVGMGMLPLLADTMAAISGKECSTFSIREIRWLRPLQTPLLKAGSVSLLITEADADQHHAILGGRGLDGNWKNFSEATLSKSAPIPPPVFLDIEQIEQKKGELSPANLRIGEKNENIQVSDRWNCLRAICVKENEIFAHLELPDSVQESGNLQALHPGLLDSAVSLVLERPGLVPASCSEIQVYRPLPPKVLAHATKSFLSDEEIATDVSLFDMESGLLCITFSNLRFIAPANRAGWKVPVIASSPVWVPAPAEQTMTALPALLLIGEGDLYEKVRSHPMLQTTPLTTTGSHDPSEEALSAIAEGVVSHILLIPAPGNDLGLRVASLLRRILLVMHKPLQLLAIGQGAFAVEQKPGKMQPDMALMAGLVMVAAREESMLSARYLELHDEAPLDSIFNEFARFDKHENAPVLLDHCGQRLIQKFVPLPVLPVSSTMAWPNSGCCVISGGTGGLALLLAAELAAGGRVALALLSRHELAAGDDADSRLRFELLETLLKSGINIRHWCVDVSDQAQLSQVLDEVRSELGPITAVVHNAGLPDSSLLVKENAASFAHATAARVDGARNLDLLTRKDPLEAFVLSGSLTAIEGRAGSGAYTASNAFLDTFAIWRRSEGRVALTIDWCQIGKTGMAARIIEGRFAEYSLSEEEVIRFWRWALSSGSAQVSLLYGEETKEKAEPVPAPLQQSSIILEKALAEIWAETLGYEKVEYDDEFYALGGDSMSGIDIVDRIVKDLGHPVTFADLTESSTVRILAARLRTQAQSPNPALASRTLTLLTPAPPENRYPLGWEQLAVIRAQMAAEKSIAFNLPNILTLPQDCNPERLEAALGLLIARHDILRTRFHLQKSEPEMEILSQVTPRLPRLRPREGMTTAFYKKWVRPFDLETELPYRFELVEHSDGKPEALLIDIHHSLADGLSLEILTGDLAALYAGINLTPLSLQFKDYAWWSRKGAGIEAVEDAKKYWLERYSLPLPLLDLPTDRARPPFCTWQCESVAFSLPKERAESLRRFASAHSTTPFTVVLATWAALLARYCNSDDIVIAVPVDARDRVGTPGMPGMMVSLLPLRFSFEQDESVDSFIKRVHANVADAMSHRACPLGMLLEALAPPVTPERTLLSEVTLSYMNYAEGRGVEGENDDAFRLSGIERSDGKNDLSIFMRDLPQQISVVCEYYSAIFDRDRIERMGEHFNILLAALTESQADDRLAYLPLLSATEKSWLDRAGNITKTPPLPAAATLFEIFSARSKKESDAIAVSDHTESLSYGELLYRAGGIAKQLIEAGVCEGDTVAMHMERSCTAIATILGINAVGACYLPLDPAYPPLRIAWILSDASCRIVVADASGRKSLAEADKAAETEGKTVDNQPVAAIRKIIDAEKLAQASSLFPGIKHHKEPLAYIMYTSGSTGLPKGVRIFERGIISLVVDENYVCLTPLDHILQIAPLAFDVSTFEIWGTLLNGARLYIPSRNEILDPVELAAILKCQQISIIFLTTGLFNRQAETLPESFSTLRTVITGGDTISPAHVRLVMESCPSTTFINGYGPTENTTFSTTYQISQSDLTENTIPIGRPLPHSSVRVQDDRGQLVPIGIWGEIVTGGDGVADGYLNQPELTAARFFSEPSGNRYYRTGDLGRWRKDGVLEFGGRKDGQIKLRGFRIELAEIEAALLIHPLVKNASVLFRPKTGELIACLLSADKDALHASELRSWLLHRIPAYMVPARFIQIESIPVNANGKVDRFLLDREAENGKRLPDDDLTTVAPPESETEKMIAEVFSEIFVCSVEDRNTSFLDLGGHSLIIIRAINRIAQRSGIRLAVSDFFSSPTLAALASRVDTGKNKDKISTHIPCAPQNAFPFASHSEERLYMMHSIDTTAAAYNMTFMFRAGREFRREALRQALLTLVDRHESLRTGFEEEQGVIIRRIENTSSINLDWKEEDLGQLSDPFSVALQLTKQEVSHPFNLRRPPLLRVRLMRLGEGQNLILIITHHIVHDGWSSRIFLRELQISYLAAMQGTKSNFTPLPLTVRDYAIWQRTRDWSKSSAWWKKNLQDAPEQIVLPCDRPLPEKASNKGATLIKELPPEIAWALQSLARQSGASMAALALALFSALLFRLTRQCDMVIGMGVAGRDHAELEGVIGFFVNVLPIRIHLDEESEFNALVTQVHEALMAALEHRDYPFDCLVRDLAPKRTGNRQPLINVVFEYQRFEPVNTTNIFPPAPPISETFERSLNEVVYTQTAKHDLIFFYVDQEEKTELMLEYNTDILDAVTIERWLDYFIQFAKSASIESLPTTSSESELP